MKNVMKNLFDVKGLTVTLVFVFVVFVAFLVLDKLHESPLGQDENSRGILENAKTSISILTDGYFLADTIAGAAVFILLVLWLVRWWRSESEGSGE